MRNLATPLGLAMALLLGACLPASAPALPQSPLLSVFERKSGQIAYLGSDLNVYVVDQSGRNPEALTDDARLTQAAGGLFNFYRLPTWSRDAKSLAFVGVAGTGDQAAARLYVADVKGGSEPALVYESETDLPYYMYWAPDNSAVSFLAFAPASGNQILRLVSQDAESTVLDVGSPFYLSWSPAGSKLLVHAADRFAPDLPPRLAFLSVGDGVTEIGLDLAAADFRAPAWSPDGRHILIAAGVEQGKSHLALLDAAGQNSQTLADVIGTVAFAWSSDSTKVAYISGTAAANTGIIGPLTVIDIETRETLTHRTRAMAFFWSPDGREIAYFVPRSGQPIASEGEDSADFIVELNVLDVETGESRVLTTYRPTAQFAEILPAFDQYHQSTTIWSPDSRNLVLPYLDEDSQPRIAVLAASGNLEPRHLADGVLAFWSWK